MDEIALVALLVVSVFLFVSNFGIGGAVGGAVSRVLFGLFGLFAYAAPVFMLILVLFSLANKDSLAVKIKIAGFLIASISLSAFCHLLIMSKIPTEKITDIFSYCSQHKSGGGVLGGLLATLLKNALGIVGTCLVLAGILIICTVVITGRSFVKAMSNGSQKAYESARDDMKKRREISEQRKEERKIQRLEKRVSGVGQDLVIPKDASNGLQEVKEEPAMKEAVPENARVPAEILVGDGIAEVTPTFVLLLVDSAERPEDIDKNRAEAARIRAEERLQHKQSMHEYYQTKIALDRAMQRLQTASKYKR